MSEINLVKSRLFYLDSCNLSEYLDVKLVSNSGECFYSNRVILSSLSPMFYNMLRDSFTHDEDITCIIAEYSSDTLKNVLDFIATGILFLKDSKACKNGVVTDRDIFCDFLSFGIDLSSLQLVPAELPANGTLFVPLADQIFDQIDIKEELELENCDFDKNIFDDPENIPLKRKKKGVVTKAKSKLKPEEKTIPARSVESRKNQTKLEPDSDVEDSDVDFDYIDSDASDEEETGKKKWKRTDPEFESGKPKSKSRERSKYRRKEFCGKTDGERDQAKRFQCPYCVRGYDSMKMFKLHVLRHEAADGRTVFFCLQCGSHQRFETAEELKKHKLDFHRGKTYTCDR